jgi:hypothetical protein
MRMHLSAIFSAHIRVLSHYGKVFTYVFDCDQHRNLFLCESHKRTALIGVRRADHATAVFECSATARLQRRLAESDPRTGQ